MPLGGLLLMIDHDLTEALRSGIEQHLAAWIWSDLAMPLLVRPAWLVPAALGIDLRRRRVLGVRRASRRAGRTGAASGNKARALPWPFYRWRQRCGWRR